MSNESTVAERILARISKTEGCWLWTGCINREGYGHVWADGRQLMAHRWVYQRLVGPIPPGLEIDHLCRVKNCVNPAHLEPVTHAENVRRAGPPWNAGITHCKHGHEYTPENTYMHRGTRYCRSCNSRRVAEYKARKVKQAARGITSGEAL